MKLFSCKKGGYDAIVTCGMCWWEWGLPFSVRPYLSVFDSDLMVSAEGDVEFKKVEPVGWGAEITINFLCCYLYIDINRWYSKRGDTDRC